MITQVRGTLRSVGEESLTIFVDPFELEILIPDHTRRTLQSKVDQPITLQTIFYIEGGVMGGRMVPRLIGFLNPIDREFFDIFCSVDGVGVRKALRAMVRPVRELARMIQDQDVKLLATFPGIGEATAERIVAKLRRKVGIYAMIVGQETGPPSSAGGSNGEAANAEPDVIRDCYAALLSVGHSEAQARQAIDKALTSKKKFKSVADMIETIYQQSR